MSTPPASTSSPLYADFRSDTVTKPTPLMRTAMFESSVGDDVFGDDTTVNQLQNEMAKLIGKEASLFVPSGTMSNLLAALVHCNVRGSEMLVGSDCHMFFYEQGNSAQFGGIHSRSIPNEPDGTLNLQLVEKAIRVHNDVHQPITQLICIENTHNRCGGRVLPISYMQSLGALARRHKLKLHVDGARLFNAAAALDVSVAALVADADSVSICLSKGLGAPIGSLLCGSHEFIAQARRLRKALGGGMRQVGVIAAAGLVALHHHTQRLVDDHRLAKQAATAIHALQGFQLHVDAVETNIVYVNLLPTLHMTAAELRDQLKQQELILISATDTYTFRIVTHFDVQQSHIDKLIQALTKVSQNNYKP